MTTLEHVAMEARPYPTHLLEDCDTGLVLFAAAFKGWNDAIHFAMAGMVGTCVDVDKGRLDAMRPLYPDNWSFYASDAWKYAEAAQREDLTWDAVSVDTFTGEAMDKSLRSLELWCSIASKVVTVTLTVGAAYTTPAGWNDTQLFERATGVYWLVLERG